MPNLNLMINKCQIENFYKAPNGNYAGGKLIWIDGTIQFEKRFHTFDSKAILILETFQPEGEFLITGTLTKKSGKKGTQWEDKMFEEIIIEKAEALQQIESIEDDKIPF